LFLSCSTVVAQNLAVALSAALAEALAALAASSLWQKRGKKEKTNTGSEDCRQERRSTCHYCAGRPAGHAGTHTYHVASCFERKKLVNPGRAKAEKSVGLQNQMQDPKIYLRNQATSRPADFQPQLSSTAPSSPSEYLLGWSCVCVV
jgi:hypothetical protein